MTKPNLRNQPMNRIEQLEKLKQNQAWDIIIIGGGANGLGVAVDAASRGSKQYFSKQSILPKAPQAEAPNWRMAVSAIWNRGISPLSLKPSKKEA